jgi:rfaE bifunctional protein kinase chain/domain
MIRERLAELLKKIRSLKVGVIGDFCLDAYWIIDPSLSERSVETGKPTFPVKEQRISLGGAGNIAANLAGLRVKGLFPMALLGADLFGRELKDRLENAGADPKGILFQEEEWTTPVYCKPYIQCREQERFDFGAANRISPASETALLSVLEECLPEMDAVIVNQQLGRSILSPEVIQGINSLAASKKSNLFVVDSRNKSHAFQGVVLRLNAFEAARLCGRKVSPLSPVSSGQARTFAVSIHETTGKPVFISLGAEGSLAAWRGEVVLVPGIPLQENTDPVGAGDTSVSAIACALAAGASPLEAAELANLASAVTVRKLKTTGIAAPEEILDLHSGFST